MGAFFSGLKDAFLNGLDTTTGQSENKLRKQQTSDMARAEERKQQQFNIDSLDKYLGMGANIVGPGGVVHEKMNDTSAPADMPDAYRIRPADPKLVRTIGQGPSAVQIELPTPEAQDRAAIYKHMQDTMGVPQQQIRSAANQNVSDTQQATTLGQGRGKNRADVEKRDSEGIAVPSALDEVLPGISKGANGGPNKVLPSELDDLTRSAGQFANYQSEAAARKNPTPKATGPGHLSVDGEGNQTLITEMNDGSVKETPIKAKGTPGGAKAPNAYQQFQMGRDNANDARSRVKEWQDKLDKAQSDSEKQWADTQALDQQVAETQSQLAEKTTGILGSGIGASNVMNAAERYKVKGKLADLQKQATAARAKAVAIDQQKKGYDVIRRSVMGANGIQDGGQAPATGAASAAPKKATLGQVNAYAKKYGLDLAAAQKAFEADGVTVVQ